MKPENDWPSLSQYRSDRLNHLLGRRRRESFKPHPGSRPGTCGRFGFEIVTQPKQQALALAKTVPLR